MAGGIGKRLEIWHVLILPTCVEGLHHSTAAFRETGITQFTVVGQDLAPGGIDHLTDGLTGHSCQPLIALAVVIRTDIEAMVILMVIPSDVFMNLGSRL